MLSLQFEFEISISLESNWAVLESTLQCAAASKGVGGKVLLSVFFRLGCCCRADASQSGEAPVM
jgi:hypothetical protein